MHPVPAQTKPFTIFFLVLPFGVSSGFASVCLPYLLVTAGFSVSATAAITALGLSANFYRFIWGPLTDLTLTLHRWYGLGLVLTVLTIILLGSTPLRTENKTWLTLIVFISQVAATLTVSPVGGFMGNTVAPEKKGLAGGWFQAANLGGMGLGGGAGLWIAAHYSFRSAAIALGLACALCGSALYFTARVEPQKTGSFGGKMKLLVTDMKSLFRSKVGLFTSIMVLPPLGVGAAAYVWSSVGPDWGVGADQVALVTGVLSALVSAVGCVAGGWIADRFGRWWAFFGAAIFMVLVSASMAAAPFTAFTYTAGILTYAFAMGLGTGAFSAIVLLAIGGKLASTKYAVLSSLSNLPVVYMTALDGWMHDKYQIRGMLWGETIISSGCIAICLFFLWKFRIYDSAAADTGEPTALVPAPTSSETI